MENRRSRKVFETVATQHTPSEPPALGRIVEKRRSNLKRAELAAQQALDENNFYKPPVLPKEIAENYGYKVRFASFSERGVETLGFSDFSTKEIYVNTNTSPERQTFTIAHELGHALMHMDEFVTSPHLYCAFLRRPFSAVTDPHEAEANEFAAKLLVPRAFLNNYYDIASISELSRLFIVPEEVIRWRLNVEYEQCNKNLRGSEPTRSLLRRLISPNCLRKT